MRPSSIVEMKDDYAGNQARSEHFLAQDGVRRGLYTVRVQETMQPEQVSVWLKK